MNVVINYKYEIPHISQIVAQQRGRIDKDKEKIRADLKVGLSLSKNFKKYGISVSSVKIVKLKRELKEKR